ncbi:DUF2986 domain-containing protein [Vibrio aestuarianus]|uniref:DUF2986 domain-containing protein n=1 Tax=Vibrio aestuarianus TaxID=28171 RepID=A0A9X4F5Z0_9VIBR|nr:DUF2986 domain-containing protein [Vibrio aestuarianus]MDE1345678.1 DUF2986 domain-containing protein [Vibrio aestuarianus]
MNRKKKINQALKKHLKKKNAKLHPSNKPRYISKAERAKLEAEQAIASETTHTEQSANAVAAESESQQ